LKQPSKRLIIVSNRLPILCHQDDAGNWKVEPSSGGLVTALDPVFKNRGGMWIGWPGTVDAKTSDLEGPLQAAQGLGYRFIPVSLSKEERDNFYLGFSNEIIWPLFHDLQGRCRFEPAFFRAYEAVNKKFSPVVADRLQEDDLVWVQDYHLMGLAKELRDAGVKNKITFFLHIPFPPLDIFLKLPWRSEILQSLLEFDVIGFQTVRDVRNFMQCVRMLMAKSLVRRESTLGNVHRIHLESREVSIGSFPVSIDFKAFSQGAASPRVAELANTLREDLPERQLIIGVDRLDYTKGIPFKLRAFETALKKYPELVQKVTLIQNVVPSREDIHEYQDLKNEIEQMVGEINGRFTQAGWIPIHYHFHSSEREEVLAYYRMAGIAMVTPLKDGMNLVAKEYCAANLREDGVLILSEFAGAAAELQKGALLVNPYDIEGVAQAIYQAFHMNPKEKRRRMKRMRIQIEKNNIFKWADSFLKAAIAEDLSAFPESQDYLPSMNIA
jgi:alpha,alpha-trehalose-phosphate synthase [UDP-forming]